MAKFFYTVFLLSLVALDATPLMAEEEFRTFRTGYATIYYADEKELKSFFRRISGNDMDLHAYPALAENRLDRIVEKVQALLDMYPSGFYVNIYVYPRYKKGHIAFYSEKTKSITTYADKISDGVLAHEIAHAVINAYFPSPPPTKVAEILCQYVDRHLWEE